MKIPLNMRIKFFIYLTLLENVSKGTKGYQNLERLNITWS